MENQERIHNINLKPISEVNKWDTKRVKNYMTRIQMHISYLESKKNADIDYDGNNDDTKQTAVALNKFVNYKVELKNILSKRDNI